jgi:hypothetical protein
MHLNGKMLTDEQKAYILVALIHSLKPGYLSGTVLGYGLDDWGLSPSRGCEFFSSQPHPDRFWDSPNLLSNGYRRFFPGGKAAGP